MVLTEWPEGSQGPVCLKGDIGLSFCSPGTQRAMLALVSLPADSEIAREDFANRRCSHQLAVHSLQRHTGQRENMLSPSPCSLKLSCLNSGLHLIFIANASLWAGKAGAHGEVTSVISLRRRYASWGVSEKSLI